MSEKIGLKLEKLSLIFITSDLGYVLVLLQLRTNVGGDVKVNRKSFSLIVVPCQEMREQASPQRQCFFYVGYVSTNHCNIYRLSFAV